MREEALIGEGVYSYIRVLPGRISFEIKFISKEIRRAEHEYMNITPPAPPINALVTPLRKPSPRVVDKDLVIKRISLRVITERSVLDR